MAATELGRMDVKTSQHRPLDDRTPNREMSRPMKNEPEMYNHSSFIPPSSGRGSITKGTSGKSLKFHASTNVLKKDFLVAQEMASTTSSSELRRCQDEGRHGKMSTQEEQKLHKTSEQLHHQLSKFSDFSGTSLTAANLIEAIIYLQINKLDKSDASSPPSELSNRLFSPDFIKKREHEEDAKKRNEKMASKKQDQKKSIPLITSAIKQEEEVDEDGRQKRKLSGTKSCNKDIKTRMIDEWLANQGAPPKKQRLTSPLHKRTTNNRVVTASDRIEAIIAADIGSQDTDFLQNKGGSVGGEVFNY